MRVEFVAVGSELLNGDLADTHTARLGRLLRSVGLGLQRSQTVPDHLPAIVVALSEAARRAQLVLVSGGLGSTDDDLTMAAASAMTGQSLVEDAPTLARIRDRYHKRGRPFLRALARQALVPEGATALENRAGLAPAVRLTHDDATFFFFPGVPRELERLLDDHLRPWLDVHAPVRPRLSQTFKLYGKTESATAALLEGLQTDPRLHVAYRAHFPEIQVTLHVDEPDADLGKALLTAVASQVRERLGALVYSEDPAVTFPQALAQAVAQHRDAPTVAIAESCTGGLVGKMITDVPGVSAWFLEGLTTYSNAAKTRLLEVPPDLLAQHGAVSEAVVRAMAEGVRERSGAQIGIATTGIAGPGGGSPDKPVGTVYIAIATPDQTTHRLLKLPFDRERNRIVSAWAALEQLRRWALTSPSP
jgi:nicotinamide-nucleotide amidase